MPSGIVARKYPTGACGGRGEGLRSIPLIIYMCVKHVRQDVGWDAHMLRPENQIKAAIYHPLVFNGYAKRKDLLHMFGVTEGSGGGKDGEKKKTSYRPYGDLMEDRGCCTLCGVITPTPTHYDLVVDVKLPVEKYDYHLCRWLVRPQPPTTHVFFPPSLPTVLSLPSRWSCRPR